MKSVAKFLICLIAIPVLANEIDLTHEYDTAKMQSVIQSVQGLNTIPMFEGIDGADEVEKLAGEPNDDLLTLFKKVQFSIFGKDNLITLKLCKVCGFQADYFAKTVYITPSEVELILSNQTLNNPVNVLTYILTHELSHFIHEVSAHPPHSNTHFTTVNGLLSAYISDVNILMNLKVEDVLKAHAEVDGYATLVLKNNGFTAWDDIYTFLDGEISRQKASDADPEETIWVIADFANRKRVITEVVEQ